MYQFKGKVSFKLKPGAKYNSRHKMYHKWLTMLLGCYDVVNKDYWRYGKVGIKVVDRWHDFDNFVNDISPIPDGMFLGRIRIADNFGPDNFKWMDRSEHNQHGRNVTAWLKSIEKGNEMAA